jgi:hypothetical protein
VALRKLAAAIRASPGGGPLPVVPPVAGSDFVGGVDEMVVALRASAGPALAVSQLCRSLPCSEWQSTAQDVMGVSEAIVSRMGEEAAVECLDMARVEALSACLAVAGAEFPRVWGSLLARVTQEAMLAGNECMLRVRGPLASLAQCPPRERRSVSALLTRVGSDVLEGVGPYAEAYASVLVSLGRIAPREIGAFDWAMLDGAATLLLAQSARQSNAEAAAVIVPMLLRRREGLDWRSSVLCALSLPTGQTLGAVLSSVTRSADWQSVTAALEYCWHHCQGEVSPQTRTRVGLFLRRQTMLGRGAWDVEGVPLELLRALGGAIRDGEEETHLEQVVSVESIRFASLDSATWQRLMQHAAAFPPRETAGLSATSDFVDALGELLSPLTTPPSMFVPPSSHVRRRPAPFPLTPSAGNKHRGAPAGLSPSAQVARLLVSQGTSSRDEQESSGSEGEMWESLESAVTLREWEPREVGEFVDAVLAAEESALGLLLLGGGMVVGGGLSEAQLSRLVRLGTSLASPTQTSGPRWGDALLEALASVCEAGVAFPSLRRRAVALAEAALGRTGGRQVMQRLGTIASMAATPTRG